MYDFLARRIHEGKLSWDEVSKLKPAAVKKIKAAYTALYPGEELPK